MKTGFRRLNDDWNAQPNAPDLRLRREGSTLILSFLMNSFVWKQFSADDAGVLRFYNCSRYRLGGTNDEGWYLGQCRFSRLAPAWGEFYEVTGDLLLEQLGEEWTTVAPDLEDMRHYLFYFKDETFECDASSFDFEVVPDGAKAWGHRV